MMFRFSPRYFLLSLLILGVEIFIAVCLHDGFIRPYVGDFLVVILLYCLVKSFLNMPVLITGLAVLLFAYLIETLQFFRLADRLHLQHHSWPRIMLGDYFTWTDILAYTLGIASVLILEKSRNTKNFYHEQPVRK